LNGKIISQTAELPHEFKALFASANNFIWESDDDDLEEEGNE
jgi:hypothetical protein